MTLPRPKDAMRATLAIVLVFAFLAAGLALFRWAVPEGNRDLLTYMLGQLSGMVTTALAFYFATSKSSADKNDILGEAVHGPREVEVVNRASDPVPTTDLPRPDFGHEDHQGET